MIAESLERNQKFSITLKHSLDRNQFLNYLASVKIPKTYEVLSQRIVTPRNTTIEHHDEMSKLLRDCVLSHYRGIEANIRLVLNEYEYVFRPKYLDRVFTVILMFEDKNEFNKMKLKHPKIFENIKTFIVGDIDDNGTQSITKHCI
jgi:hypothetical protein